MSTPPSEERAGASPSRRENGVEGAAAGEGTVLAPPATAPIASTAAAQAGAARPDDVLGSVWAAKWWILLATVLVAGATLAVSLLIPPTYGSSADIRLTVVGQPNTPASDSVKASNDLASQYAQDVLADGVMLPAAAAAGVDPVDLRVRPGLN